MRTSYFAAAAIGFVLAGCAMGGDPGSTVPHDGAASSARTPLMAKPMIRPSVIYYADNANTVYAVSQGASGSTPPARTIYPSDRHLPPVPDRHRAGERERLALRAE